MWGAGGLSGQGVVCGTWRQPLLSLPPETISVLETSARPEQSSVRAGWSCFIFKDRQGQSASTHIPQASLDLCSPGSGSAP